MGIMRIAYNVQARARVKRGGHGFKFESISAS